MEIKLKHVNSYRRYGRRHYQFRRKGFRKVTLRGKPGSAEFMAHYAELLALSENRSAHVGASLIKPGSIDALIIKYVKHTAFTSLAEVTQATRRRILDHFRDFKTPSGKRYGDARYSTMIEADIHAALKGRTPNAQEIWMKTIRHLVAFAKDQSKKDPAEFGVFAIKTDPTVGITTDKPPKSDGHLTWGDEQIAAYRERHDGTASTRIGAQYRGTPSRCQPDRAPAPQERLPIVAAEQDS
jgi:hypothetical protein